MNKRRRFQAKRRQVMRRSQKDLRSRGFGWPIYAAMLRVDFTESGPTFAWQTPRAEP